MAGGYGKKKGLPPMGSGEVRVGGKSMAQPQLNYNSLASSEHHGTLPPIKSQKENLMIDPDDGIRASYDSAAGKALEAWASNAAIK